MPVEDVATLFLLVLFVYLPAAVLLACWLLRGEDTCPRRR